MKQKSDTRLVLMTFIQSIEIRLKSKVKTIRTDNGPEFSISQFYSSKGIHQQTSWVENPQQNGIVERKHRHILNVARALRFHAHLPLKFWGVSSLSNIHLLLFSKINPLLNGFFILHPTTLN